ncbi:type VI secretion system baseplate subunit TssE [Herbaspirillum seropedicae]|uniref:type VI secretion system baseplate subunit TssE n=1 Tax=Herbaspirillum seropedicae TaxID=964 RepID=UPI003391CA30
MKGFAPSLFDRLMHESDRVSPNTVVSRLSIEELKDAVARDLEAMLNTRAVIPEQRFRHFPECSKSIIAYGLNDFAGMSLASLDDRAAICRSLEEAIARHEPRLRNVRASLEVQEGSINRLNFAISALLVVNAAREAVSFDAVLQPSSLQYSISKGRATRIGV